MAESETTTELPSSADAASTTSIARPWSSCTSARVARPSAVGAGSSSSTTSARQLRRLMLRWIMSPPPPGQGSLRQRVPPEEDFGFLVRLAEPLCIGALVAGGRELLAQGAVHQETEVVVAVLDRQRQPLVGVLAVEDHEVLGRLVALDRVQEDCPLGEE